MNPVREVKGEKVKNEKVKNEEVANTINNVLGLLLEGVMSSFGEDGEAVRKEWDEKEAPKIKKAIMEEGSVEKLPIVSDNDQNLTQEEFSSELTDKLKENPDIPSGFAEMFGIIFTTLVGNLENQKERTGSSDIALANVFTPMLEAAAEDDGIEFNETPFVTAMDNMDEYFGDKPSKDKLPI